MGEIRKVVHAEYWMRKLTGGSIVIPGILPPLLYRRAEPADSEFSRQRSKESVPSVIQAP